MDKPSCEECADLKVVKPAKYKVIITDLEDTIVATKAVCADCAFISVQDVIDS